MTKDEIVLMARKADLWLTSDERWAAVVRFANLVAAAEREACAMEAEYEAARWAYAPEAREPCEEVAKAIRARGEK